MKKTTRTRFELGSRKTRLPTATPSGTGPFPVVGIGASAGGLEAFTNLLQNLPGDTGMGFVLVQHLDPNHESALVDLLSRVTPMPVHEATDKLKVEANHVYVIPPNARIALKDGFLLLSARKKQNGAARSIDFFLESLAGDRQELAIGVILSGTASDGTAGLQAVRAGGGITFAQDDSAKFGSMPQSAIAAGCVDFVLSPQEIGCELARIAKHPYTSAKPSPAPRSGRDSAPATQEPRHQPHAEPALERLLLLLKKHSGVDFSLYKQTTIQRRITRRVVLSKSETLEAYVDSVASNSAELDSPYSDLLINVTSFFRNPEVFAALKRKVFPGFLKAPRDQPVRFWVLGCSTGQEAYSLAIAFQESCKSLTSPPKLQIFATDLNEATLEKARRGLYPKTLVHDVSPERIRRFFVEEEGGFRVSKSLRDLCVFARQNLLSDPPFSHMDLISCRNLLIYIEPASQQKIVSTFHYALNHEGCLVLGASESIGTHTNLFEPVDKKLKLFRRNPGNSPALLAPAFRRPPTDRKEPRPAASVGLAAPAIELTAQREADRLSVARFAPPAVLVDAGFQILQFRGVTAPYLQAPSGKPTNDLLKMARPELMLPLRAALKKAQKHGRAVRSEHVRIDTKSASPVTLEIIPLNHLKDLCYLIFFEQTTPGGTDRKSTGVYQHAPEEPKNTSGATLRRRVAELGDELTSTRDYLQSLQEQHETAIEELQASNEEVTSSNEELQSINEELETSKEELESTNEELTTVNEEMSSRNLELNRLNSDLNNLHISINTPILLLDGDLRIRRFTAQAERLFNLTSTDIGRPLAGIQHNLAFDDLESFTATVVTTVAPRECEVQDKEGKWFALRVRPYLSLDNKIDGAVLVLTDIDSFKQNERKIRQARDYASAIVEAVPPLLILDPHLRVQTANGLFYETFRAKELETVGQLVYELGNGQWNIPALRRLLEEMLPKERTIHQYEVSHNFEGIGQRSMLVDARRIDHMQIIILSFSDITERKNVEMRLMEAKEALARHASELERVVDERTSTLRETVRELEAFSYSMVHDMRAPLRAMNSFALLLHQEYGSQLDATARGYLTRIFSSAERLDQLIRDVLNYTHVLRDPAPLTPVRLEELLRELQTSYPEWAPPRADVQIIAPMPPVLGHAALLAQVFSNLVSNAIRFVAPGVQPCVRIRASLQDARVRISVQDNGIGILPESRHRIFGMFQRIQPSSEYEGTGIGLTIVRRAVERMGGLVGFDSEPGKGSTFWLELPPADVG